MNNGKKWIEDDLKAYKMRRLSFCNKEMMYLARRGLGSRIAKENLAKHTYVTRSVEKWNDEYLVYGSLCVMRINQATGGIVQHRIYWDCGDVNLVTETSKSVVKYYEMTEEEGLDCLEEPSVRPMSGEDK